MNNNTYSWIIINIYSWVIIPTHNTCKCPWFNSDTTYYKRQTTAWDYSPFMIKIIHFYW